jgi:hypothetical protein
VIVSQLLVGDEVIEKGGGARIWPWGDRGSPTCDHRPQAGHSLGRSHGDVIGTSSSHEFVAKVSPVDIRVEKGKVTLTGTTRGPIGNVEEVVRSVPGVTDVENRVVVVRYGAA